MRTISPLVSLLLPALPLLAQNPPIDLNLWTVEHINGAGPWTIDAPRYYAQSTNTLITDSSVLYSNFNVSLLDFRMSVDPAGGDDDLIGFVLGWLPGDSANTTADYILVDWKKVTQAYQNWGTAQIGLAMSRVTGTFTRGYAGGPIDLWSHTGNCVELMRSPTYGQAGWQFATDYFFRVLFTPASVDIWVNGSLEFSITGTFTPGRFGCYNYSQSRTDFQFPIVGAFSLFGSGCQGSAGTPYLFGPTMPLVGQAMPIIVANLLPTAVPILVFGVSNTNLQGTPLPVGLGPYGAPGCTLNVSNELLMPVTNWNGTAYTTFQLPSTLPPSVTPVFFVQAMVVDPAANSLGLAMSNAGSIAIGIR